MIKNDVTQKMWALKPVVGSWEWQEDGTMWGGVIDSSGRQSTERNGQHSKQSMT